MDKTQILERLTTHLHTLNSIHKETRCKVNIEWLTRICSLIGIPKEGVELCAQILALKPPTRLVWLHLAECTGCSSSFLRLDKPDIESVLLEYITLEYHETIMGAVGFSAKKSLHDALDKEFILVIEGGISLGNNAHFLTSGADSITGEQECKEVAQKAQVIFAVGTCSSFGGVQAAYPNPTQSIGVDSALAQRIINIPGCPPSEANIIGSILYYILLQELPPTDSLHRPIWSYGKNLHDMCERKAKFESGDFVQSFDDVHLQDGYCLYKVGCKGPYVFNNCPKVKFNAKTSYPIQAGHGCIACSEPDFWDSFGRIEEPLNNANAYLTKQKPLKTLPCTHTLIESIPKNTLCLEFDTLSPTRIYTHTQSAQDNLIALCFQSHLPTLLMQIAKRNKLGARLVENYQQWRVQQQLPHINTDEDSQGELSRNASDILKLVGEMFGKSNPNALDTLQSAQSYLFPHISRLDMKLNGEESCNIEIDKSLRLPLCYLLGGLEIEGVAYGAVSSICEILSLALTQLCTYYHLEQVVFKGNLIQNALIQDRFATYLPKWIEVV
ncbi:hydrogenase small subunit [Helicobacter sp. MIT 21-1697]|uniref:hydrogenase small subunit n=1 Tax=Helicobacter sp. MIT 21-1697 TaxID=2993733 RepID=UPI00224A9963|nr:hydrogenase small subunit [Helicobacter sp. MIT 21-1697]MCX2717669.1 hydrogenase small subunit [Helicobacter sp. MIT 21-1697]